MIQLLANFCLSPCCIHCKVSLLSSEVFCPQCRECIEYILPNERCQKCFTPTLDGKCIQCRKNPTVFQRTCVLFDKGSPATALLKDCMYFEDTLVALFYHQVEESSDCIEAVCAEKPLTRIGMRVAEKLYMPFHKKIEPRSILYLSTFGLPKDSLCCTGVHLQFAYQ